MKPLVLKLVILEFAWIIGCVGVSMVLYGAPLDLENGLYVWIVGFAAVSLAQGVVVLLEKCQK